jgi:hypothetical protein
LSTQTQNLGLIKQSGNENYDIDIVNQNLDSIDDAVIAKLLEAMGYTDEKINQLVNAAPGALDTLKELSTALGDDPNFRTTILNAIAGKVGSADFTAYQESVNTQLATKFNKEAVAIDPNTDILTLPLGHYRVDGAVSTAKNYPYTTAWTEATITVSGVGVPGMNGYRLIQFIPCDGHAIYIKGQQWNIWNPWTTISNEARVVTRAGTETVTGYKTFDTSRQSFPTDASGGQFEVKGTATIPPTMLFHYPGKNAFYFGMDTDYKLKIGGYSMGASKATVITSPTAYRILTSTVDPTSGDGEDGDIWIKYKP